MNGHDIIIYYLSHSPVLSDASSGRRFVLICFDPLNEFDWGVCPDSAVPGSKVSATYQQGTPMKYSYLVWYGKKWLKEQKCCFTGFRSPDLWVMSPTRFLCATKQFRNALEEKTICTLYRYILGGSCLCSSLLFAYSNHHTILQETETSITSHQRMSHESLRQEQTKTNPVPAYSLLVPLVVY